VRYPICAAEDWFAEDKRRRSSRPENRPEPYFVSLGSAGRPNLLRVSVWAANAPADLARLAPELAV
jgi:hypothetical protein